MDATDVKNGQAAGVSADLLKAAAMVTMVIDHAGAVLFPEIAILRLIGRISFPIFTWLLVMGFTHTSNLKKYIFNMGTFAVISEVPFDLALAGRITAAGQNIYFTLFLDLVMLYVLRKIMDADDRLKKAGAAPGFIQKYRRSAPVLVVCGAMLIAGVLNFDYGCAGPVLAAVFYLYVRTGRPELAAGFTLFSMSNIFRPLFSAASIRNPYAWMAAAMNIIVEFAGIFSVPLISRYNGVRKWKKGKYFFYFFYPLHLLIIFEISKLNYFS